MRRAEVDVPPATASAVTVGVVMLLFGFAFYASLYAVAGSMASSVEDAQASAGPLGFLTAAAYAGTLIGVVPNPDSAFAQALTCLPPTAPFAVPARITVDSISTLEIVIASVVTAVAAVVTTSTVPTVPRRRALGRALVAARTSPRLRTHDRCG